MNVNRNVNANRRIVYRNGVRGYWRNGRWIAAPLAVGAGAGVAGYVATCAYEYNRWQSTGSTYWRSRYNQSAFEVSAFEVTAVWSSMPAALAVLAVPDTRVASRAPRGATAGLHGLALSLREIG